VASPSGQAEARTPTSEKEQVKQISRQHSAEAAAANEFTTNMPWNVFHERQA
jgi:hypothetical protein